MMESALIVKRNYTKHLGKSEYDYAKWKKRSGCYWDWN